MSGQRADLGRSATSATELNEPEIRAVLAFLPLDFAEDEPLGTAFLKLSDSLCVVAGENDISMGRRAALRGQSGVSE